MKTCKDLYDAEVYHMVTDNATVMTCMCRLLAHIIWFTTCMSHTGNLLAKDLLDIRVKRDVNLFSESFFILFNENIFQVDSVQECFRRYSFATLVEEAGGKRPKTPSEIRWCYNR